MPRLKVLDLEQAPPSAGQLLGDIVRRHGDAGEIVRVMANSPALLRGCPDLSRATRRIKIPRAPARAAGPTDACSPGSGWTRLSSLETRTP
jgi:hypothetical protein